MKLLSREEIYQIDEMVLNENCEISELIQEVGSALEQWFVSHVDKTQSLLFAIGPGNNGNDALVVAQRLRDRGYSVAISIADKSAAKNALRESLLQGLSNNILDDISEKPFDVVVDGIFGIGLDRSPTGEFARLIEELNYKKARRIAIDIPSGLDANTGALYPPYFRADHTLCISALKRGLFLLPGTTVVGQVEIIPVLRLDEKLHRVDAQCLALEDSEEALLKISANKESNKYAKGKLSVVLCDSYPGAALLSALAADQVGAGYVQVFCPEKKLATCQITYPQFVFKSYRNHRDLRRMLAKDNSSVFVMGPGWDLGRFDFRGLIDLRAEFVFDGSLLQASFYEMLKKSGNKNYVITPHSGELSRLLGVKQLPNRWETITQVGQELGGVLIAKGFDTLIAQGGETPRLCTWNSPSLAKAGTGDVLAGLVGGLMVQGLTPFQAACAAVDLHRKAASQWSKSLTTERLIQEVGHLVNQ